jgi:hypothetical protein
MLTVTGKIREARRAGLWLVTENVPQRFIDTIRFNR